MKRLVSGFECDASFLPVYSDVSKLKKDLSQSLPSSFLPISESLDIVDIELQDIEPSRYLVLFDIGVERSDAEKTSSSEGHFTCSRCGSICQDPEFKPSFFKEKIRDVDVLVSFYHSLRIVCRDRFVEAYKKSRLSGISFDAMNDCRGFSYVTLKQHSWCSIDGVCDDCGTKTNCRGFEFFNLEEDYLYDFQFLRVFGGELLVLSRRAFDFLGSIDESMCDMDDVVAPIIPGYMKDVIAVDERFFDRRKGEYPHRVVRRSYSGS